MDRILSVMLGALAVVLVIFLVLFSLSLYMGITYRSTLRSTYDYEVTIGNDAPLGNVTLYLPIPGRLTGNSPVLERIGEGRLEGLPPGWSITLIGTEKVTLLEVTAPEIPPAPAGAPYRLSLATRLKAPIATATDGSGSQVLAPVAIRSPAPCTGIPGGGTSGDTRCWAYRGSAYADYTGPRDAQLRLSFALTGKNAWDVLGPSSNEYRDRFEVSFSGDERGWKEGDGLLATGIGDYGMDFWVDWIRAIPPKEAPGPRVQVATGAGGEVP